MEWPVRCGDCRWFDGDGWLDENGRGKGECCIDPPIWVGWPCEVPPSSEMLCEWLEAGWQRPMVGVAAKTCSRFEEDVTHGR